MDSISPNDLQLLVETIGQYCAQRHHTNIRYSHSSTCLICLHCLLTRGFSFSSIGLLWRVSDHLDVLGAKQEASSSADQKQGSLPSNQQERSVIAMKIIDSLIISVFSQLKVLFFFVVPRSFLTGSSLSIHHCTESIA
jgi:hypothetical protein